MKGEIIGVKNPYALAELLSDSKIDWKNIDDHRAVLEKTLGMDYKTMFDSERSPLFIALTGPIHEPIPLPDGRCREAFKRIFTDDWPIQTPDDQTRLDNLMSNINYQERGYSFDTEVRLDDSNQGIIPNCFLIATISAIQAVDINFFRIKLTRQPDNHGGFRYFYKMCNPEPYEVFKVDFSSKMCWLKKWYNNETNKMSETPVTGNNWIEIQVLLYTRSSNFDKTWSGLIEKAYYTMIDRKIDPLRIQDPPDYEYIAFQVQKPRFAMCSLLNLPLVGSRIKFEGRTYDLMVEEWGIFDHLIGKSQADPAKMSLTDYLKMVCGEKEWIYSVRSASVIDPYARMWPRYGLQGTLPRELRGMEIMVEHDSDDQVDTYATRGGRIGVREITIEKWSGSVTRPTVVKTWKPLPDYIPPSANLIEGHAYTVLGYLAVKRSDTKEKIEYIVLRNPWGHTDAATGVYGGAWVAPGSHGSWHLSFPEDDGVFALKFDVFLDCFDVLTNLNTDLSVMIKYMVMSLTNPTGGELSDIFPPRPPDDQP